MKPLVLLIALLLTSCAAQADRVHYNVLLRALDLSISSKVLICDTYYTLPTDDEVMAVLNTLKVRTYKEESADCDDFVNEAKGALSFHGWPIAFIATDEHYLLAWFNVNREWVYLDPQNMQRRKRPKNIHWFIV